MNGKFCRSLVKSGAKDTAANLLCHIYNSATNPAKLRTDREHNRARQQAQAARNLLNRLILPYYETESGRLQSGQYVCDKCGYAYCNCRVS